MVNSIDGGHAFVTQGEQHLAAPASLPACTRAGVSSVLCVPSASPETRVKHPNLFIFCKTAISANLPDDAFHETQTKQESKNASSSSSPNCTPGGKERVLEHARRDTRVRTLA